jgi:hypothetical protein
MKYLVQWHAIDPARMRPTAEHFLKAGAKPPDGATQLGRWFGLNGSGCSVIEAADTKPVFELISEWQEYLQIEATPVLEDDEFGAIVAKLYG